MSMLDQPLLTVLSFGFAALGGACFVTFAQRWSTRNGREFGRLAAGSIVIAFAWWSAVLLMQLALSPAETTLGELNAALLAVPPLIGGLMAALLLEISPQRLGRFVGAAGVLTIAALLPAVSIALASQTGIRWLPLSLTAGLVFVCLLPALLLVSPAGSAPWRNLAALLLLAIGVLLPQILRLFWWPAGEGAIIDDPAWLGQVITIDTGATIALFLLSRHLLGHGSPLRDVTTVDPGAEIAARLQAAQAERENLVRLHGRHCDHIMQSANVGLFEWDVKSGGLSLGGSWASMLDYEEEEALRLSRAVDLWRQLCHPQEIATVQRHLRRLARGQREHTVCEVRLRSARDTWRWTRVDARVVDHFPDGSPQRVLGTLVDIDRLKRTEYALLAERRLFASGPVIVVTFEAAPPHRLRQASSNLPEARGHPDHHLPLGEPLADLFHREDAASLAELTARVIAHPGVPAQREVRVVRVDNSWRWYVLHVLADRPATLTLRAYLVDINRLKEAESNIAAHNQTLQGMVKKMAETQQFMQTLQQFTELLQVCESEAESRQIIIQGGPQLFPGWSGALTLAGVSGLMEVVASWGEPFVPERTEETDCWAVRRGHLHQSNAGSPALSPVCGHFGGGPNLPPGIQHAICAPLLKSFDRPGALHLVARRPAGQEELQAIAWGAELFANALKLSLGNLRLRASLREQAVHDVMTDLFNRRYFDEVLRREVSRCERTGEGLILAIIDIDHFKSFNDTYGHEAGDRVLRAVAEQLQDFVRAYDIACRVGGEELAVIMPRAHVDEGFARLDQLREDIGRHRLTHNGVRLPAVNVSIGLAEFDGNSADNLMRRADAALYAAKHGGRNRVMRWEPEMEQVLSAAQTEGERRPTRH